MRTPKKVPAPQASQSTPVGPIELIPAREISRLRPEFHESCAFAAPPLETPGNPMPAWNAAPGKSRRQKTPALPRSILRRVRARTGFHPCADLLADLALSSHHSHHIVPAN